MQDISQSSKEESFTTDDGSIQVNIIESLNYRMKVVEWVRKGRSRRAKFPRHLNDIIANWNIEKISIDLFSENF